MSIKCLIVDDEPLAIEIIEGYVAQIPDLLLVATFENPISALDFLNVNTIDLIFMDIEMPLLTGVDFVKTLKHRPQVIFTTAYRNYAIESYELEVVDYLLKPVSFARFFKAVNRFKKQTSEHIVISSIHTGLKNDHIYVNANKKFIKVLFDDIIYVESIKDYIRIHTVNENVVTRDKISEFEKKIPENFLRVHRSYIVNTHKITAFTSVDIEIESKEIPIGESYKKEILSKLKKSNK
ncbi:LytR/AlgR family response regulator transcription factor [Spongiimicrobium salis]|uniref:LytR/AlgR family response regulator transcription factor n=1 Tax=Spongiimicrobium salis TaxID=1667022 RepID=UPI00374CB950